MSAGVDRDAWASIVADLVKYETGGKKAAFARAIGVEPRTVSRWLAGEVDVSERSVRDAARAFGRSPTDMLVRVGFLAPDDLGPKPAGVEDDEEMRIIMDAKVPMSTKKVMIQRLEELRRRDRERRMDEIRWGLRAAGGGR